MCSAGEECEVSHLWITTAMKVFASILSLKTFLLADIRIPVASNTLDTPLEETVITWRRSSRKAELKTRGIGPKGISRSCYRATMINHWMKIKKRFERMITNKLACIVYLHSEKRGLSSAVGWPGGDHCNLT